MNSEITHLISTGQIELALQKMLDDYPAAIQLSAQYYAAKNDKIAGVLNFDDWSRAQARITSSMLEILKMAAASRPAEPRFEHVSNPSPSPSPTATTVRKKQSLKIFMSYARKDEDMKADLDMHLAGLRRAGKIEVWHDRKIEIGDEWDEEIHQQLMAADIILLLVSPAFNDSEFIWREEIKIAMERHAKKEVVVVPIIIKYNDSWKNMPFAKLQALPRDAKPVSSYADKDQALAEIAGAIRRLVDSRTSA